MRAAGLAGLSRCRRVRTTSRGEPPRRAPDLLERDFTAAGPDRQVLLSMARCIGAVLVASLALSCWPPSGGGTGAASHLGSRALACGGCNLVLVSVDTLRADHLSLYGHPRPTSPRLDAFAERAVVFENAFSTSRKTAPSHMSMFTSLYPTVHQVYMYERAAAGEPTPFRLHPTVPTLTSMLRSAGLRTAGWHGGGNVSESYGFDRGFEEYVSFHDYRDRRVTDPQHFRAAEWRPAFEWMARHVEERFFVFLHTYAVHDPYQPPDPYRSQFVGDYAGRIRAVPVNRTAAEAFWANVDTESPADVQHLIDLYDGAIRFADDHLVGALIAMLERTGLLEKTIVVIVSDHGEEFGEHGAFTHNQLYDEILHVPFVLYVPPAARGPVELPGRIPHQVSLVDLTPTLLELLDVEPRRGAFQGRSLVPVLRGEDRADREVYAVAVNGTWAGGDPIIWWALRAHGSKLIAKPDLDVWEVYDLAADPGETIDLSTSDPHRLAALRGRLADLMKADRDHREELGHRAIDGDYTEETLDQLRALGYID